MKLLLKTPLLQNGIGKQLALLSFTGRRTGRTYTIPLSYARSGNRLLILTRKRRLWWRNFAEQPEVELRLAGQVVHGTARAQVGTDHDVAEVVDYLETRPVDAKTYGATRLAAGSIDPESVRAFLPETVLVRVDLS
jgi:hypothetical protein